MKLPLKSKNIDQDHDLLYILTIIFVLFQTVQHGFPHKPTALAYDPKQKLMAIGTHSGAIKVCQFILIFNVHYQLCFITKVFGRPGVEFYGQHSAASNKTDDLTVQLLEWVSGTGRILSLTRSNELVLWEPAGAMLVPIKSLSFEGKLKKVSSLCCSALKDVVWIGTEGGNVYQFDLKTFSMRESVIYHDVVLEK